MYINISDEALQDLLKMSIDDRIKYVKSIYDRIASEPKVQKVTSHKKFEKEFCQKLLEIIERGNAITNGISLYFSGSVEFWYNVAGVYNGEKFNEGHSCSFSIRRSGDEEYLSVIENNSSYLAGKHSFIQSGDVFDKYGFRVGDCYSNTDKENFKLKDQDLFEYALSGLPVPNGMGYAYIENGRFEQRSRSRDKDYPGIVRQVNIKKDNGDFKGKITESYYGVHTENPEIMRTDHPFITRDLPSREILFKDLTYAGFNGAVNLNDLKALKEYYQTVIYEGKKPDYDSIEETSNKHSR